MDHSRLVLLARRLVVSACVAGALASPAPAQAAFPGANGKIVFASNRDDPFPSSCIPAACNWELYTVNPDGTGLTRITFTSSQAEVDPAWSPDGQTIVFQRGLGSPSDIYKVNATGGGYSLVIANGEEPGFTPDGTKIVFRRDPNDPNQGLNTVNLDGSGLNRFFQRGQNPAWSPDGAKVAIQETCCGGPGIATINPDGTGEVVLDGAAQAGHDRPNWSPDGSRIAYQIDCCDLDAAGIWVIDRNGTGKTKLRWGQKPAWSPDGKRIAFAGSTDFPNEIVVMNADGTGAVNLSNSNARDQYPDWQPLGALNPFPRPGGGSPLITYLVPAFQACTVPNSQHVGPLDQGSCTPPVQVSNLLTTSTVGQGSGFVRLDTISGNPLMPPDEADVRIESAISDVRRAVSQADYSGPVLLSSVFRITDRASGFGGVSGTVSDFRFDVPITCTPTAVAPNGSDCQVLTTADSLLPGMIAEGKRSVVSTPNFKLLDAGPDGSVSGTACPPTCGTGDENTYLEQGTFTP